MSANARDMCDLYRAEMALEHAWMALDRARHALPVKSHDAELARRAQQTALECSYLGNLAFTYACSVYDLMIERHGGVVLLKVLVACEESQAVANAVRARGHEAYSCDLKPCSGGHPEYHIVGGSGRSAQC